ncbi:MAG: FlgD immunoglobulin-like domain containing protein, partial [Gemmatimonadaceae bacterium]
DSRRLWANVEAADGGLYRSDDAGATWARVNASRDLWQRAFYFMRLTADPKDRETIYVLNFLLEKSTDGGKSFTAVDSPHADHHDLWIDPGNARRMIEANDGGASVSVNGGDTWTGQRYPTAQMYRVATTDEVPYHVCGAQQDNTTACVASDGGHLAPPDARIGDWYYEIGGGESADIASKPGAPDIFFAGSTNTLTRYDRRTGQTRDVQPNPRIVMGEPASAMPERWNWTYPLAISPANPRALYAGSQHLWKTTDEGRNWHRISPDLTRADPVTMGNSGGPIILDQDGPEIYATIFAIAPSRRDSNAVWVGSDDGLVHVTRDGGATWRNVTPRDMPANTRVSRIDASPHRPGGAYIAAERQQMDDRAPYIWKTDDYGATWTKIVNGIGDSDFVRVVREDRIRPGLLFAGAEHGVYVSFDDGGMWRPMSLNLPDVQVSDMVVESRDLVIATHGRSFWVLDDISPLRQATAAMAAPGSTSFSAHLLRPASAVRRIYPAAIHYYLAAPADSVALEIHDRDGRLVRRFDNAAREAGMHRVRWELRYPGATVFPGIVLEGGDPRRGPWAPPGAYQVRLTAQTSAGVVTDVQELVLTKDPRLTDVSDADLREQFALATQIRDRESAANEAVIRIRGLRHQIAERLATDTLRVAPDVRRRIADAVTPLAIAMGSVEEAIYQVKNQSPKDKIAFPIRLNDRLTGLRTTLETGDARPTSAHERVFRVLAEELELQLRKLDETFRRDVSRLNTVLSGSGLRPVVIPGATPTT